MSPVSGRRGCSDLLLDSGDVDSDRKHTLLGIAKGDRSIQSGQGDVDAFPQMLTGSIKRLLGGIPSNPVDCHFRQGCVFIWRFLFRLRNVRLRQPGTMAPGEGSQQRSELDGMGAAGRKVLSRSILTGTMIADDAEIEQTK